MGKTSAALSSLQRDEEGALESGEWRDGTTGVQSGGRKRSVSCAGGSSAGGCRFPAEGGGCVEKRLVSHRGLLPAAPVAGPGQGGGTRPGSGDRQTLSGAAVLVSLRTRLTDADTVASATPSLLHCSCHCGIRGVPMLLCPSLRKGQVMLLETMTGRGAAPSTMRTFFHSSQTGSGFLLSVVPLSTLM